jgi:lipoyl(octanoyl) transferase
MPPCRSDEDIPDTRMEQLPRVLTTHLGRTRYAEAWELQKTLWALRAAGRIDDLLLLTEHEHVYTIGKSGDNDHLLASAEELRAGGVDVFDVDRGGDITYHGPGQLVGYPILDLNGYEPDIHKYLHNLEEVIIRALALYGVRAGREEGFTGVWVNGEKIAALGVKVGRWVTMHGFAFNVNADLSKFGRIIPCGIFHKGVTSLDRLVGHTVEMEEVAERIRKSFADVFRCTLVPMTMAELHARAAEPAVSEDGLRS